MESAILRLPTMTKIGTRNVQQSGGTDAELYIVQTGRHQRSVLVGVRPPTMILRRPALVPFLVSSSLNANIEHHDLTQTGRREGASSEAICCA